MQRTKLSTIRPTADFGSMLSFLELMLLIRSSLSISMDHPRLYFNDDCTSGSDWVQFTPLEVPGESARWRYWRW
jgi:hypothetical protein